MDKINKYKIHEDPKFGLWCIYEGIESDDRFDSEARLKAQMGVVEQGLDIEDISHFRVAWREIVSEIEKEYPNKKLKELMRNELRDRYRTLHAKRGQLYAENDAERAKGTSYEERKKIIDKIRKLDKYIGDDIVWKGTHLMVKSIAEVIKPSDLHYIVKCGIEGWLRLWQEEITYYPVKANKYDGN